MCKLKVKFATSNRAKLKEIQTLLAEFDIDVEPREMKKIEIQSDDIAEIAEYAALDLARKLRRAITVEDSGLHVSTLKDFPGPYSSYIQKVIGLNGILKLLKNVDDRTACFESVVAYARPQGYVKCFKGVVWGDISYEPRGEEGFGFDPIFIPNEGDGRTFAEMSLIEKNRYSHRSRAVRRFGRWISTNNP